MSNASHKRRRLECGIYTPFKSPLKQRLETTEACELQCLPTNVEDGSVEGSKFKGHNDISDSERVTVDTRSEPATHHDVALDAHDFSRGDRSLPWSARPFTEQPQLKTCNNRMLVMEERSLRSDITILEQARGILTSNCDEDLKRLTKKWKLASRPVVEELLSVAKEKVNRAGGMQAWRKQEQRRQERKRDWAMKDAEEALQRQQSDSDSVDDDYASSGEQQEESSTRRDISDRKWEARQARTEAKEQARDEAEAMSERPCRQIEDTDNVSADVTLEQDSSYTIDLLLKTLGINTALVGWDSREHHWLE